MLPLASLLDRLFDEVDYNHYSALRGLQKSAGLRGEYPVIAIEDALEAARQAPNGGALQKDCLDQAHEIAAKPHPFFDLKPEERTIDELEAALRSKPPEPQPGTLMQILRRAEKRFVDATPRFD